MQIAVVRGSSPEIFNAMMFPELSQDTQQWVSNQFHHGLSQVSEQGRGFIDRAVELSKSYFSSEASRTARRLMRELKNFGDNQYVQQCDDYRNVRSANRVSQRYFMANPVIRKLYHQQLCDGYSDSYVDAHPEDVGEFHYDYRRVMNGIVQETTNDDGEYEWFATMYTDDIVEGDRELDPEEQHMVLRGWDLIEAMVKAKQDPTDIFGGTLEI